MRRTALPRYTTFFIRFFFHHFNTTTLIIGVWYFLKNKKKHNFTLTTFCRRISSLVVGFFLCLLFFFFLFPTFQLRIFQNRNSEQKTTTRKNNKREPDLLKKIVEKRTELEMIRIRNYHLQYSVISWTLHTWKQHSQTTFWGVQSFVPRTCLHETTKPPERNSERARLLSCQRSCLIIGLPITIKGKKKIQ